MASAQPTPFRSSRYLPNSSALNLHPSAHGANLPCVHTGSWNKGSSALLEAESRCAAHCLSVSVSQQGREQHQGQRPGQESRRATWLARSRSTPLRPMPFSDAGAELLCGLLPIQLLHRHILALSQKSPFISEVHVFSPSDLSEPF